MSISPLFNRKWPQFLATALIFLSLSGCGGGLTSQPDVQPPQPTPTPTPTPTPGETTTAEAVSSGNWSDAAVWKDNALPAAGATITIPNGISVKINSKLDKAYQLIKIEGELTFAADKDTQLIVDTLQSSMTGRLQIGSQSAPVEASVSAKIIFADNGPITKSVDPDQLTRGAVLMGPVEIFGAKKTAWLGLATQPAKGESTLTLETVPEGWQVGDRLVVAATDLNDPTSDDLVTIAAINGKTVTLSAPLAKDHLATKPDLVVHVANLSRNIEFSSQNPAIKHRGHIMFMHNVDVNVNYARFYQLGRTDKSIPLDDWTFPELDDAPGMQLEGNNIRGRYSVHFHRGGTDLSKPAAKVVGTVVEDNPGWAYVNHSSNVDFIDNVSYRVVGGAFQTEAGDETGSFINNIALHTINPNNPLLSGAEQLVDIREDRQDFAFQGDGFWLHGGLPKIEGNVVSGATGHAYIYWTEGLIEANLGMMQIDPSYVRGNNLLNNQNKMDVWWVPVTSFKNNIGYASVKGLVFYYLHATFLESEASQQQLSQAYRDQLDSTFEDVTLWRILQRPLDFNYSEKITMKNFRIVGDGVPQSVGVDANHFHLLSHYTFDNFVVEDFEFGMDVPTQGNIVIRNGKFSNRYDFRISNPQFGPRDLKIEGVSFSQSDKFPAAQSKPIMMSPNMTLVGNVQDGLDDDDGGSKNPLFFLMPDRITLNFGDYNDKGLYFNEQVADFIPMISANAQIGDVVVPSEYVEKTNQQLKDSYNLMFGGVLMPSNSQDTADIVGGRIGPVAPVATNFPPEIED